MFLKICQKLSCSVSLLIAQVRTVYLTCFRNCLRILIFVPCLLELESVDYCIYGDGQYDNAAGLAGQIEQDRNI